MHAQPLQLSHDSNHYKTEDEDQFNIQSVNETIYQLPIQNIPWQKNNKVYDSERINKNVASENGLFK